MSMNFDSLVMSPSDADEGAKRSVPMPASIASSHGIKDATEQRKERCDVRSMKRDELLAEASVSPRPGCGLSGDVVSPRVDTGCGLSGNVASPRVGLGCGLSGKVVSPRVDLGCGLSCKEQEAAAAAAKPGEDSVPEVAVQQLQAMLGDAMKLLKTQEKRIAKLSVENEELRTENTDMEGYVRNQESELEVLKQEASQGAVKVEEDTPTDTNAELLNVMKGLSEFLQKQGEKSGSGENDLYKVRPIESLPKLSMDGDVFSRLEAVRTWCEHVRLKVRRISPKHAQRWWGSVVEIAKNAHQEYVGMTDIEQVTAKPPAWEADSHIDECLEVSVSPALLEAVPSSINESMVSRRDPMTSVSILYRVMQHAMRGHSTERLSLLGSVQQLTADSAEKVATEIRVWKRRLETLREWGISLPDHGILASLVTNMVEKYESKLSFTARMQVSMFAMQEKVSGIRGSSIEGWRALIKYCEFVEASFEDHTLKKKKREGNVSLGLQGTIEDEDQGDEGLGEDGQNEFGCPGQVLPEGQRVKGKVLRWFAEKKYGFVKVGDVDIFVHQRQLKDGNALKERSEVELKVVKGSKDGRYFGEGVTGASGKKGVGIAGNPNIVCLRCGEKGHVAAVCRNSPKCLNCNGPHARRDCPSRNNDSERKPEGVGKMVVGAEAQDEEEEVPKSEEFSAEKVRTEILAMRAMAMDWDEDEEGF